MHCNCVWWHDTLININNNDDNIKILTLILKWCCYSNIAIGPKLWFAVILSHCSKTSYMNNKTDIQGKKLAIHSIKFEFIFWIQNKHLNNFSLSKWISMQSIHQSQQILSIFLLLLVIVNQPQLLTKSYLMFIFDSFFTSLLLKWHQYFILCTF